MGTITSANSVYTIQVPNLFPSPQVLQGYAADAAFETDASESIEVMKGIDGLLSAGYVPFLTRQTITLQADSPSATIFEQILESQKTLQEVYFLFATITLPSISRKYNCTQGVLSSIKQIPDARKVLQARAFVITWADISPTAF